MKKSLLFLLGASLLGANSFAAEAKPDRNPDPVFMSGFDKAYSVYLDQTNRQSGIKGLTSDATKGLWIPASTNDVVAVADGILTIQHNEVAGDNWSDISLSTFNWRGDSGIKFKHLADKEGKTVDTLGGMFVDMSKDDQVSVTLSVKVSANCQLRVDLVDANGRQGNGTVKAEYQNTQRIDAKSADGWKEYKLTWAYNMYDFYSGDYWQVKTGMRDDVGQVLSSATKVRNEKAAFGAYGSYMWFVNDAGDTVKHEVVEEEPVPVCSEAIGRIMLVVDDYNHGTLGVNPTVEIKDFTLGKVEGAVDFVPFTKASTNYDPKKAILVESRKAVSDASVSAASALVVYPNPAKGQITVNENVTVTTVAGVATGVAGTGVLDISSLVAGTYYVVGTTGTTTLVVE